MHRRTILLLGLISWPCGISSVTGLLLRTNSAQSCDAELGDGFLRTMREHQVPLCSRRSNSAGRRGASVNVFVPPVSGDIVLYSSLPEPAEGEVHVAILEDVRMKASSDSVSLHVDCEDHGIGRISDAERGGTPIVLDAEAAGVAACTHHVEEDTILVESPRGEYYGNLYHSMEEVFAMFETASLLNRSIGDFRFLVGWNRSGAQHFFQFDSQVEGDSAVPEPPPGALKGIIEMWSALVARKQLDGATQMPTKGIADASAKLHKLQALPLPVRASEAPRSICFRRLVLPMRASDGSILPRAWSPSTPCPHGSAIAEGVSRTILQAFGRPPTRRHAGRVVTLVVDFGSLSFAEQVKAVQETDVLVGVHGAGLTHVMLLPQGAGIVEISPDPAPYPLRSVANIFANMAAWTKHPYRAVRTRMGSLDSAVEVAPRNVERAVTDLMK